MHPRCYYNADVYNLGASEIMNYEPNIQLEVIRSLRDLYFEHMEGCDAQEFIKWERLYRYATYIEDAMKADYNGGIE